MVSRVLQLPPQKKPHFHNSTLKETTPPGVMDGQPSHLPQPCEMDDAFTSTTQEVLAPSLLVHTSQSTPPSPHLPVSQVASTTHQALAFTAALV